MADPLRVYAREAASRAGIDPEWFVRQIDQESGFNPDAHNHGSGADGIAQIVVRWHPTMAGKTRDPYASLDYAAGLMRNHLATRDGDWALALSNYNAGPHATTQGLAGKLPGWPYPETVRYVSNILQISQQEAARRLTGAAPVTVTYNAAEPAHAQEESFDCSQESAEWSLWSVGRRPSDDWLEQTMIAEDVMSKDQGLLDATGAGLAAFLTRHYGEFGYSATNEPITTFDALKAESGRYPLMIGGRAWSHWSGLRGYDGARDVLLLANPSDGWGGVGQTMNRDQFANLGPFSLVRLTHPDLSPSPPSPPPLDPTDQIIAGLRVAVAHLADVIVPKAAAGAQMSADALTEARAIREQFVGVKP